jgi:hypothetical protein
MKLTDGKRTANMPKDKKKIHDLYSPRIAAKRKRRSEVNEKRARDIAEKKAKLEAPASDDFRNNKPLFGPHRIQRLVVPVVQRKISPTEGIATVNAKTGKEVKKLIHKPVPKNPVQDVTAGAIEVKKSDKKKRGRPKGSKNAK